MTPKLYVIEMGMQAVDDTDELGYTVEPRPATSADMPKCATCGHWKPDVFAELNEEIEEARAGGYAENLEDKELLGWCRALIGHVSNTHHDGPPRGTWETFGCIHHTDFDEEANAD